MDETGTLLSAPRLLRVLVGRDDLLNYRGAGVQCRLVTAIECISADGRSLDPLIIWPATTHRNTWTTHPTPGWHFACSESGYTNSAINLYWIQHVFDPATRSRANGKPRILISDGFAPHEQLFRGGANTIGKQHFTLLYDCARKTVLTFRNVRSGWSKTGLWPFNPDRVLGEMSKPSDIPPLSDICPNANASLPPCDSPLRTPTDASSFKALRVKGEAHLKTADEDSRLFFEKIANAAELSMAMGALMDSRIEILQKQNDEKRAREAAREAARSTILGRGKILSWPDIVAAREKQDQKAASKRSQTKRRTKHKAANFRRCREKRSQADEVAEATRQIAAGELAGYCNCAWLLTKVL